MGAREGFQSARIFFATNGARVVFILQRADFGGGAACGGTNRSGQWGRWLTTREREAQRQQKRENFVDLLSALPLIEYPDSEQSILRVAKSAFAAVSCPARQTEKDRSGSQASSPARAHALRRIKISIPTQETKR